MAFRISILTAAFSALTLSAADWPRWRGAQHDGICKESGLLKEWPTTGPKLVWKAAGLGAGYSGISIVGNRIFTAGETGAISSVICLDATKGAPVWIAKLGKSGAPGWGGFAGPRATPTVDGENLYVVDQWGEMVCMETSTGKELWRKNLETDFGGKRPEWGFSESPLVDGEKVVITPGGAKGAVVALNKKTGAVLWQSKQFTDPAHYSSLVPAQIAGVRQYVQLTPSHVAGFSPSNGELLWQGDRPGKVAVIPDPVCDGSYVYVTSGYGVGCNLFQINSSGAKLEAKQVYANKNMMNHHGGVVKVGGYVYGHSDTKGWMCQDFKTGEVKWVEKDKLGKGSILAFGDRLVLRDEKAGVVALIEATDKGWNEHGRFNQQDRTDKNSWPHPVIAYGKLYLRDQDILLCYDVAAPKAP